MKKNFIRIIKCLFALFFCFSLNLISCSNPFVMENSIKEVDSSVKNWKGKSYLELNGKFGDYDSSRSAFPAVDLQDYFYSISVDKNGNTEDVLSEINGLTKTYTVRISEDGVYTITITGYVDQDSATNKISSKKVVSGSTVITVSDMEVTDGSSSVVLEPISEGIDGGSVKLPVTIDSVLSFSSVYAKWTVGGNEYCQTLNFSGGSLTDYITLINDGEPAGTMVPCGAYTVRVFFEKYDVTLNKNVVIYSFVEPVGVYNHLETNVWKNSTGAPYINSGEVNITSALIEASKRTVFVVDNVNGSDTTGTGGFFTPLKTLQKAYDIIESVNNQATEYQIILASDYTGNVLETTEDSTNPANPIKNILFINPSDKLKLRISSNPSDSAIYSINANADWINSYRHLYIGPKAEVTISGINLTNGYVNYGLGGAIYNNGKLTLGNNVTITDNCAEEASAVFSTSAGTPSALTLDGAYIHDNSCNSGNYGVIVSDGTDGSSAFSISGTTEVTDIVHFNNETGISLGSMSGPSTKKIILCVDGHVEDEQILHAESGVTISYYSDRFKIVTEIGAATDYYIDDEGVLKENLPVIYSDWNELCAAVDAIPYGTTTVTTFYIGNPETGNLMVKDQPLGNLAPVKLVPYKNEDVNLERDTSYTGKFFNVFEDLIIEGRSNAQINIDGASVMSSSIINNNDAKLTVSYLNFTQCMSNCNGAAIYIGSYAEDVTISHCTFINNNVNHTSNDGAAIYTESDTSPVTIEDCVFTNNNASAGGALCIHGTSYVLIKDSNFTDNYCTGIGGLQGGGAIYLYKGDVVFDGVTMSGNHTETSLVSDVSIETSLGSAPKVLFKNSNTINLVYYDFGENYPYGPLKCENITAGSSVKIKLSNYTYDLQAYKVLSNNSDPTALIPNISSFVLDDSTYAFTPDGKVSKMMIYSDGIFKINNLSDLKLVRDTINSGGYLAASSLSTGTEPLSYKACEADYILTDDIDCGADNWTPIYITDDDIYYSGTFDGNNKTITYKSTSGDSAYCRAGLFGFVHENGTVKNLKVKATVSTITSSYTGGIVCYNAGTIQNCSTIESSIAGKMAVGGITGFNASTGRIIQCQTDALTTVTNNTTDADETGGIAGYSKNTIQNCKNYATVSSINQNSHNFGGIVGYSFGGSLILNSNYGSVTAGYRLGGIAGYAGSTSSDTLIDRCQNYGNIVSTRTAEDTFLSNAGGIVGILYSLGSSSYIPVLRNCSNAGDVTISSTNIYTKNAGGIAGEVDYGKVSNCINSGTIKGGANVGGIFGFAGTNSACQNFVSTGTVTSKESASGGLICGNFFYGSKGTGGMQAMFVKEGETQSAVNISSSGGNATKIYTFNESTLNLTTEELIWDESCTTVIQGLNSWCNMSESFPSTAGLFIHWKDLPEAPWFGLDISD